MLSTLEYQQKLPKPSLLDYVDSYWMLENRVDKPHNVIVLPDGRVDMFLSKDSEEPFHTSLSGIGTRPDKGIFKPRAIIFAISFRLPAVEILFGKDFAGLLDTVIRLPRGYEGFSEKDLSNFEFFCQKADRLLTTIFKDIPVDSRKQKLFDLVYGSEGNVKIGEIADKVFWSRRQINRYFNNYFGLNLKAYCNILRFRSSFSQIKAGRLFPESNFADQSHFIKEVKKHAHATPKRLNKNKDDRFIQFSLLS